MIVRIYGVWKLKEEVETRLKKVLVAKAAQKFSRELDPSNEEIFYKNALAGHDKKMTLKDIPLRWPKIHIF